MLIDFVVTWVDQTDSVWQEQRKQRKNPQMDLRGDGEERYRDPGFLKFWFRAVENYAPWVNKIYFVTSGHLPEWLDINHPKIVWVKHEDYIPDDYLPTFNSNVIELNLHRIKDLSEHFVIFNDDVFLNLPVSASDFFVSGKPKDFGIYKPLQPKNFHHHTIFNNLLLVNKHFVNRSVIKDNKGLFFNKGYGKHNVNNFLASFYPDRFGYYEAHISQPVLKSKLASLWSLEPELLDKVCHHPFRSTEDISHYVLSHWNIETANFVPQAISFGQVYLIDQVDVISKELQEGPSKVICINDGESSENFSASASQLVSIFEEKFPIKSKFER